MAMPIDTMVVAAKHQVSCELGDEAVILHLASGVYYGLDEVGARIWSLIQEPRTVRDVRDAILDQYDVEANRCERDLLALLDALAAQGLIKTQREDDP